jgi:hypothetical protein
VEMKKTSGNNVIEVVCKACGQSLQILPTQMNSMITCGHCGNLFPTSQDIVLKKHNLLSFREKKKDRRKFSRKEALGMIDYWRHGQDERQMGVLLDISQGGLLFISDQQLLARQMLRIRIKERQMIGRVCRCEKKGEKAFHVHVQFELIGRKKK